jgi:hypothetical protein
VSFANKNVPGLQEYLKFQNEYNKVEIELRVVNEYNKVEIELRVRVVSDIQTLAFGSSLYIRYNTAAHVVNITNNTIIYTKTPLIMEAHNTIIISCLSV